MDAATYEGLQQQLVLFGAIVAEWPLEDFIAAIDHADTIGPIVDPTLWIRGQKAMSQVRQLAAGALEFKRAAVNVRAAAAPGTGRP